MPGTSIQKLLGHQKLNSTMIYARVHDQTVSEDYYSAMGSVERRLALAEEQENSLAGSRRANGSRCWPLLPSWLSRR